MTIGKDGATGKSNGKRRPSDKKGPQDASASESTRQNLPAPKRPGFRQDTPFTAKEESPWRIYDEGYILRVGGLVTVTMKKRRGSKGAATEDCSAPKVVAIRKLSGSSSKPSQLPGNLIRCLGMIRCRLPGEVIVELLERIHPSHLSFVTHGRALGFSHGKGDLCSSCRR